MSNVRVIDAMPMLKAIIETKTINPNEMSGRVVCLARPNSSSPRLIFKKNDEIIGDEAEEAFMEIDKRIYEEGPRAYLRNQVEDILYWIADKKKEKIYTFEDIQSFNEKFFGRCFSEQFYEPLQKKEPTPVVTKKQVTKKVILKALLLLSICCMVVVSMIWLCIKLTRFILNSVL